MATLSITFDRFTNALSNRFTCQFLDRNDAFIPEFAQNQIAFVSDIRSSNTLVFEIPDGNYTYNFVKIRVYSDNIGTGVYKDFEFANLGLDCSIDNEAPVNPGQPITLPVTTVRQEQTTTRPVSTTLGQQNVYLCADSGCYIIAATNLLGPCQFRLYKYANGSYQLFQDWTDGVVPFSTTLSTCINLIGFQRAERIRAYGNIGSGSYRVQARLNSSPDQIVTNDMIMTCQPVATTTQQGQTTTTQQGQTTTYTPTPNGTTSNQPMSIIAGPQPTYQGVLSPATHQNDTNVMEIEIASYNSSTKRAKLRFKTIADANGGKVLKILVNTHRPTLTKEQFEAREWGVENGPYLIQSFFADPNDALFQRDQYRGSYSNIVFK